MGKAVEATRLERSAVELRALAVKTEDGDLEATNLEEAGFLGP
jgi:hypothetical protein